MTANEQAQPLERARDLVDDLNLSTLGWRIPSQRLVDDFAAHEHALRAEEHELTDVEAAGDRRASRRAFSLYELNADPGTAPLVALLVEPPAGGAWSLLAPAGR